MMVEVFKYTERVINIVRPRKLLFMAIGGFFDLRSVIFGSYIRPLRWCCSPCQDESTTISTIPCSTRREG